MTTKTSDTETRWLALGIDPGLTGGVAVLGVRGRDQEVAHVFPLPVKKTGKGSQKTVDAAALYALLLPFLTADSGKPLLAVEKVTAMKKEGRTQGVTSTFTFGTGYGKVLGVVEILIAQGKVSLVEPLPQMWKKVVLKGRPGGKEASVAYCLARYPDVSLRASSRSRTDSNGLSDALCLAEYALRHRTRQLHEEGT